MSSSKKGHSEKFTQGLLQFLKNSPTPFHAVKNIGDQLNAQGFQELKESQAWDLRPKGKYWVRRNDSSILAWTLAENDFKKQPFHMVGAHTDSPCLRLKPNSELRYKNYLLGGVEIYGGVLLSTWFDRDLSLAGRVSFLDEKNQVHHMLIDLERPIGMVSSLAIHLNRKANEGFSIQKQKELPPILGQTQSKAKELYLSELLQKEILKKIPKKNCQKIVSHELYFYDTQNPNIIGLQNEFLASSRLDNLLSCYSGLQAILDAEFKRNSMLVCLDHEEVGSESHIGASGYFVKAILERIYENNQQLHPAMAGSLLISCDNAHGIHPNFPEKHDSHHAPLLNSGPVLKVNSNQRYATNSQTAAQITAICEKVKVPYQHFVMRNDMACGSTIGPLMAAQLGVATVDLGVPTFGMHSIRELAGVADGFYLTEVLRFFFKNIV